MSEHIVQKFTEHLKNALTRALCFAVEHEAKTIEPSHLLYGLSTEAGCIASEILEKAHVNTKNLEILAKQAPRLPDAKKRGTESPPLSPGALSALEKAVVAAHANTHAYVGTEHLLLGLLQTLGEKPFALALGGGDEIDVHDVEEHLALVLKSVSNFPDIGNFRDAPAQKEKESPAETKTQETEQTSPREVKTPALDYFGKDLTLLASQGKLDPVIGREQELQRIFDILGRRTKNNPVLLGEAGVGKTALVELLATRIVEGNVPVSLKDMRVISLDLSALISGTMYRGEFEARLRQLLQEIRAQQHIILFIDEIHMIVGAGSASGSLDVANVLKPALARGEIRCVGATTEDEYKKYLESDSALERRFGRVRVKEPSVTDTKQMLRGLAERYAAHHGVTFEDAALDAAVDLSHRYVTDRHLPDKAIDLLDEAASSVRSHLLASESEKERAFLLREVKRVRQEKQDAVRAENFPKAVSCKEEEQALEKRLAELPEISPQSPTLAITASHVADVLSRMTGIPIAKKQAERAEQLRGLGAALKSRVVGQELVIDRVADTLARGELGLADPNRPRASFLFIGPSGVGKTELGRAIAEVFFQDARALLRLDMSEFAEGFTVSRLLGAPAGYVGYRERAALTDGVRARPYQVILFDEFEKAHPDIQHVLLQLLEQGEVTDATGRTVSFRQTVIVLTTNLAADRLKGSAVGFAEGSIASTPHEVTDDIRKELETHLRPELLNRLDALCVFAPLTKEALEQLANIELHKLTKRLEEQHKNLTVDESAKAQLVLQSQDHPLAGRAVRHAITTHIEPALARVLLTNPDVTKLTLSFANKSWQAEPQTSLTQKTSPKSRRSKGSLPDGASAKAGRKKTS